jgi:acid stress-induced BolA-like protein IbaG/YrbA
MTPSDIHQLITQGMPNAQVEVTGPDNVHFEARVVCESFVGKLPLARHRLVYACLGSKMGQEIHALSLKTLTPAEAAAQSA